METTFITIHDLTDAANILYTSDSIVDVLGYTPDEVVGRSTWNFFHEAELIDGQKFHKRTLEMDKASVLVYCDIKNRDGYVVRCECCFSVVYDVMVACTSIYRETERGKNRELDAPIIRRLFSSSPRDPRYHMLQHLSNRFRQDVHNQTREPRAALFLNRFTRTLTIMYATSGIEQVIGIPAESMKGRSFYYCIAENCLEDSVKCLESAKGNDSIAYLRFVYRDPRQDDEPDTSEEDSDAIMTEAGASEGNEEPSGGSTSDSGTVSHAQAPLTTPGSHSTSSGNTTTQPQSPPNNPPIELEAVVSCTSDGLVVCLRRARPILPGSIQSTEKVPATPGFPVQTPVHPAGFHPQGFFAAPWAHQPVYAPFPPPGYAHPYAFPGMPVAFGGPPTHTHVPPQPIAAGGVESGGPDSFDFLSAIQECGVFAWDLCGINGSLAQHARGAPGGRAVPGDGYSVWDPANNEDTSPSGPVAGPGSAGNVPPPGAPTVGPGSA